MLLFVVVVAALGAIPIAAGADPSSEALIAHDLSVAEAKLQATAADTPADAFPSETEADGTWGNTDGSYWTSGFLAGSLWQVYQATGDPSWRTLAETHEAQLAAQATNTSTHDLGFMIYDSFGNGYRLTGDATDQQVTLRAAQSLASRYDATVGAIRSWNNDAREPDSDFQVIVDSMMNLELLFWGAAQPGGSDSWKTEAISHALAVRQWLVRPDGSTYHRVTFDADTGAEQSRGTVQGYSDSSTWARGQAWALYGFTVAYRETGDPRLLATARQLADWYVAHLPADGVPEWDFDAPAGPGEPKDSSAAAIAASGLFQLAADVPPADATRYRASAETSLTTLSSAQYLATTAQSRAILLHGTANEPGGDADTGLIYGDYFFIEALLRWRALDQATAPTTPAPTTPAPPISPTIPAPTAVAVSSMPPPQPPKIPAAATAASSHPLPTAAPTRRAPAPRVSVKLPSTSLAIVRVAAAGRITVTLSGRAPHAGLLARGTITMRRAGSVHLELAASALGRRTLGHVRLIRASLRVTLVERSGRLDNLRLGVVIRR